MSKGEDAVFGDVLSKIIGLRFINEENLVYELHRLYNQVVLASRKMTGLSYRRILQHLEKLTTHFPYVWHHDKLKELKSDAERRVRNEKTERTQENILRCLHGHDITDVDSCRDLDARFRPANLLEAKDVRVNWSRCACGHYLPAGGVPIAHRATGTILIFGGKCLDHFSNDKVEPWKADRSLCSILKSMIQTYASLAPDDLRQRAEALLEDLDVEPYIGGSRSRAALYDEIKAFVHDPKTPFVATTLMFRGVIFLPNAIIQGDVFSRLSKYEPLWNRTKLYDVAHPEADIDPATPADEANSAINLDGLL